MNKSFVAVFFVFVFIFSFIGFGVASPIYQTSNQDVGLIIETQNYEFIKIGEDFNVEIHVYNSTNGLPVDNSSVSCVIHYSYANGTQAIEDNMSFEEPFDFTYNVSQSFLTGGKGYFVFQCDSSEGGFRSSRVEVTLSGLPYHIETLWATVFLILIFSSLIFLIHRHKDGTNFDRMYQKIIEKYKERNFVKNMLHSTWYNLLKNSWAMYYSIGFIILMLVFDIVYLFNIISMFSLLKTFLTMYAWGFVVVGMVFLSYFQEFFVDLLDDIENDSWGIVE